MKLIALSCLHGHVPPALKKIVKKEAPDTLLYCGDLCDTDQLRNITFGNLTPDLIRALVDPRRHAALIRASIKSMQEPLNWFKSLKVPTLLIYGNNDYLDHEARIYNLPGLEQRLPPNVKLVKDAVLKINDIHIAGFPGYRGLMEKAGGGAAFDHRLERLIVRMRKPHNTILFTHDVPYGKFDVVKWKASPAFGQHVGEKAFNRHLKKTRLAALVCGHMHEHQGIDELYGTPIINTGYGREGKCAVIETKDGKIAKVRFYR